MEEQRGLIEIAESENGWQFLCVTFVFVRMWSLLTGIWHDCNMLTCCDLI